LIHSPVKPDAKLLSAILKGNQPLVDKCILDSGRLAQKKAAYSAAFDI